MGMAEYFLYIFEIPCVIIIIVHSAINSKVKKTIFQTTNILTFTNKNNSTNFVIVRIHLLSQKYAV